MDRVQAHKLVDQLFDAEGIPTATINDLPVEGTVAGLDHGETTSYVEAVKRELPKDQRVVRTKTSGDRVFFLDELKKTRQWITKPEILEALGFSLNDVVEIEDGELLKYNMAAALYKAPDAPQA